MNMWTVLKVQIKKALQTLSSNDTDYYQMSQLTFLGQTQNVRQLIPYGLYSSSPINSEWVIFNLRADPADKVGIGTDYVNRFKGTDNKGLKEGEVAIYNQMTGNYIFFNSEDNTIEFCKGDKKISIDKDLTITAVNVNIITSSNANITASGEIKLTATDDVKLTATGDVKLTATGDVKLTGTNVVIDNSTTIDGKLFLTHIHEAGTYTTPTGGDVSGNSGGVS